MLYQESPALLLRGARFSFTEGLSSLVGGGFARKGPGLGAISVAAHQRVRDPPPTPHSTQKGIEISGPLPLLRPVLLLIQLDDMYLTDSCTMFTIADSKHLHAHQFLR